MTKQGHWVSIAVFFVVGMLTGPVVIATATDVRVDQMQRTLWGRLQALGVNDMTLTSRSATSAQLAMASEAALRSLELEAAGDSEGAQATLVGLVRSQTRLLDSRTQREDGMYTSESLLRRLELWEAGTPWVGSDAGGDGG